ncbi:MAG: hypothetical protein GEV28_04545 [Actinophytocola sp.]|nr:hypothetical protein [Actinophytocola sp.]
MAPAPTMAVAVFRSSTVTRTASPGQHARRTTPDETCGPRAPRAPRAPGAPGAPGAPARGPGLPLGAGVDAALDIAVDDDHSVYSDPETTATAQVSPAAFGREFERRYPR